MSDKAAVSLATGLEDAERVTVALLVADNGRGIRAQPEGAGIRGMRERARLVGAELAVRARLEGGTEVRLVVPVAEEGDA